MKLVIIESPYRATADSDLEYNLSYARAALLDSIRRGEAPIASHLLYTQVLDDSDPIDSARGIALGHEWFRRADLIAFYTDLGVSDGMKLAQTKARNTRTPTELRSLFTS